MSEPNPQLGLVSNPNPNPKQLLGDATGSDDTTTSHMAMHAMAAVVAAGPLSVRQDAPPNLTVIKP